MPCLFLMNIILVWKSKCRVRRASSSNHLKKNAVTNLPRYKISAPKTWRFRTKNCLLGLLVESLSVRRCWHHFGKGWSDLLAPLIADVSPDIILWPFKVDRKTWNLAWYQTFRHCRSFGYRNWLVLIWWKCFSIFAMELFKEIISFNPRFSLGEDASSIAVYKLASEILNKP